MKCERCDNEASIEIKVVYKKGIKEYRLCSECYKKMMNSIKKGNKIENDVDIYKFLTDNLIEFYDENEHTSEVEMEVYNKEIFLSCLKCNTSIKDIGGVGHVLRGQELRFFDVDDLPRSGGGDEKVGAELRAVW